MNRSAEGMRLVREGDQVVLEMVATGVKTPVQIVWARPVTARGGELSFLDKDHKEVLMLADLMALDPASRALAEEELARRYLVARISRVMHTEAMFGTQYWHVETDRGERRLAFKSDNRNAVWITSDHLMLRDTLGCRFEINPYSALDELSRVEVEKVI